jgi:hypothetical protein
MSWSICDEVTALAAGRARRPLRHWRIDRRRQAMTVQRLTALVLVAWLAAAGAHAEGTAPTQKDPLAETEDAIVRALTRTMDLLSRTFDRMMIYEAPELLPNGDIIIRRKRPQPPEPSPAPPAGDGEKVPL